MADDPVHLHFNKVIERASTQVLRLSRWNDDKILWANGGTMLPLDRVPCCPLCKQPRKFEFQIMPQLIYLLGSDGKSKEEYPEIDFGSLVVCLYPLNGGCLVCFIELTKEAPYAKEFVYFHSHYSQKDIEEVKEQLKMLASQSS